jgi:ABC-type phosphate/phosphonate transport system substrate-binding protein
VRRTLAVLVGVVLVGVAVAPRGAGGDTPAGTPLKLGMLESMFRDVQPQMVKAMSRPFRTLFERQTGLTGDVEVVPNAETMANKMKERKLQLGVFHGFEFAQVRLRHPEIRPLVVSMPHGNTCQACVVVHKDHKAGQIADLAGESLVIPRGTKAHCLAYMEKARRSLPTATATPTPKPTLTTEEVLNSVADGTTPAALIDVGAYSGYQAIQPGAAQHLKVLCRSEVFPLSVICYCQECIGNDSLDRIRNGLLAANKNPQGRTLMMLWNLKGFEPVPADYETQLEAILKAYPNPVPKK